MSKATYVAIVLLVTHPGCGRKESAKPEPGATSSDPASSVPATRSPDPAETPAEAALAAVPRADIQAPAPEAVTWTAYDIQGTGVGFDAIDGFAVNAGKRGGTAYANQYIGPITVAIRHGEGVDLAALQGHWKRDARFRPGSVGEVEVCGGKGRFQVTARAEIVIASGRVMVANPSDRQIARTGEPTQAPEAFPEPAPRSPPPAAAPRTVDARTIAVLAFTHAGRPVLVTWTIPSAMRQRYAAVEKRFFASVRCPASPGVGAQE